MSLGQIQIPSYLQVLNPCTSKEGGALARKRAKPLDCVLCGVPWNGKYGHFNLHISFELDVIDYCLTFRILSTSFVHLAYFVLV